MMIYTNQVSKKTKKQKSKQKAAWADYCKKYQVVKKPAFKPLTVETPSRRNGSMTFQSLQSLDTNRFDTFKRQKNQYTGTAMIGVAAMHKSNLVPVFDNQHAQDVAKMRRG